MHKMEIELNEIEDANELIEKAENSEEIDVITDKNFNGDLTTIELYISLAVNAVAVIVPIIKVMIKQKKISSLKLDGEKIEVSGVSQDFIERILIEKGLLSKVDKSAVSGETVNTVQENADNQSL